MRKIIGFCGFKDAGKDTAAIPLEQLGFVKTNIVNPVKDAVAAIFNWPRYLLEGDNENSKIWRETVDPWWAAKLNRPNFTPRIALEEFGINTRKLFSEDIFIFSFENRAINNFNENILITCVRFPNEFDLVHNLGGKVHRITRGPEPHWFEKANIKNKHRILDMLSLGIPATEYAWIGCDIDTTIENNGTVEELHSKVLEVCNVS